MAKPPPDRIDVLSRRVRFVDRFRRPLSVVAALVAWVFISRALSAMFVTPWPGMTTTVAALVFAVAAWWVVEIGFAAAMAMWETEHDAIARDRGLPRAQLVRRK